MNSTLNELCFTNRCKLTNTCMNSFIFQNKEEKKIME